MFDDLIMQFNELSDEEKNALIVYKTRLGLLINSINSNPDFESYYNYCKKVLSNPINFIVTSTVFKNINIESIDTFIESIYRIKDILDAATSKLVTSEDTTVYRSISTNDAINGISKDNIISTSLSFGETLKYAQAGDNIVIYEINLDKRSNVAISPYSILDDKLHDRLIITKSRSDDEIIINKDNYDFEEIDRTVVNGIEIISVNAILKKNKKKGR